MGKGSTLVSIRLATAPDNDTHGLVVLGLTGSKEVEMRWTGPVTLSLSCKSCTPQDASLETVKTGEVLITYTETLRVDATGFAK